MQSVGLQSILKYTKEIKQILVEQLKAPTEEFVQFFLPSVYSGVKTQTVVQQFTGIVKRAMNQFLCDQIDQRSQSGANNGETSEESAEVKELDGSTVDKVETHSKQQTSKSRSKGLIVTFSRWNCIFFRSRVQESNRSLG